MQILRRVDVVDEQAQCADVLAVEGEHEARHRRVFGVLALDRAGELFDTALHEDRGVGVVELLERVGWERRRPLAGRANQIKKTSTG